MKKIEKCLQCTMKSVLLVGAGKKPRSGGFNRYPKNCSVKYVDPDAEVDPDFLMMFETLVKKYQEGEITEKFDYVIIDFSVVQFLDFRTTRDVYSIVRLKMLNEKGTFAFWMNPTSVRRDGIFPNASPNQQDSRIIWGRNMSPSEVLTSARRLFQSDFLRSMKLEKAFGFDVCRWDSKIDDLYDDYPKYKDIENPIFIMQKN